MKNPSTSLLLVLGCVTVFLTFPLPLFGVEPPSEGEPEGAAVLDFLETKDEGNLAVGPGTVKPDAYKLYSKALFFFKNYRQQRTFWSLTKKGSGKAAHVHDVALDGQGNGITSEVDGHTHEIKGGIVQEEAGHTHELNGSANHMACGNLKKKPYFFHVLGVTSPGSDGHRHIAISYFRGGRQSVTQLAAGHNHLLKDFKTGRAVVMRGRRAQAYKDAHTHEVAWIAKQYFSFDSMEYLAGLFEQAARKQTNFGPAYYYECICLQTIHEYDKAMKAADKAIRSIPSFHEAVVERGDINMWLGELGKAHDDYRRALEMKREYAHASVMDGMANLREGNFERAAEVFATGKGKAQKEMDAMAAWLQRKAKEHLPEDKQEALKRFITALQESDPKKLGSEMQAAQKTFSGADRAWLNKAQAICSEFMQANRWGRELEKEKTFPGWKESEKFVTETEHYKVFSKISQEFNDFIGGQLESAYKLYRMKFALQIPQKVQIRVFLYPDMKSYLADGAPPGSGGYANPYFKKLVWPINPRDFKQNGYSLGATPTPDKLEDTLLVLFHEAFHQYLNKFLEMAPQSFNEGCADYFGPSLFEVKKVGNRFTGDLVVRVNSWRLKSIKNMINNNLNLPLEPFWKMTKGEMYNRSYIGMNYSQAWAWVFFLFEKTSHDSWKQEPEAQKHYKRVHFDHLKNFYKALRKGKGLNRAWDACFGKMNRRKLASFEDEWKSFILNLKEKN